MPDIADRFVNGEYVRGRYEVQLLDRKNPEHPRRCAALGLHEGDLEIEGTTILKHLLSMHVERRGGEEL